MIEYPYKTEPYEHQRDALKWLVKQTNCGALLMDPGLGKTKVIIDYLGIRNLKFGPEKWLVVAPKVAINTWVREFDTHSPDNCYAEPTILKGSILDRAEQLSSATEGVYLTNHETFSTSKVDKNTKTVKESQRLVRAIDKAGFTGIVIDESHRIKGKSAKRNHTLKRIAEKCSFCILMTGTVAPNSPADVWGQWSVMNPDRLGSWSDFSQTYIVWGGYYGKQMVAFKNLDMLRKLVSFDAYIAKKNECLDLPPVTHQIIDIELSEKEKLAYAAMGQDFVYQDEYGKWHLADNALVKLLRLRQITSGFLDDQILGHSKLNVCKELVSDLISQGEKIVIFAHFLKDISDLETEFSKLDVPVYTIMGKTSAEQRQEHLDNFKDKPGPAIMVGQVRSMGISINELVVSSNAIFYSLSERREDWIQAKDRLDRNGQTRPVNCKYLIAPGTVDAALWKAYNDKQRLEDVILQNPEYIGIK